VSVITTERGVGSRDSQRIFWTIPPSRAWSSTHAMSPSAEPVWNAKRRSPKLGREVLRASTFEGSVKSAADVIVRTVHASNCRIVNVSESSPNRLVGDETDTAGPGADCADGGEPLTLRVPVGDPEQPLAYIEVFNDTPTGPDDELFVEMVAVSCFPRPCASAPKTPSATKPCTTP